MNYNYENITKFKGWVLQNFPFIEEDFDALTNYELYCKVVEYLNKVIDNNNLMVQNIEELNNWFNNLDVQEEVNNKLDEMAESGQLSEIIAEYLSLAGMITFNTVADMKNATNLISGSKCITLGYHTYNDGGSAKYLIRNITNADIVDEAKLIALSNINLVAELIFDDTVNPIQFGCYGDNTHDDSVNFQKCVDSEKPISLLNKKYLIGQTINLYSGIKMVGCGVIGKSGTTFTTTINDGSPIFKLDDEVSHFIIKDFYILGNNKNAVGIEISYPYDSCVLENLDIRQLNNTAIKIGNSSHISQSLLINNCMIYGTTSGNPNYPLIYIEKCYETNLTNSKFLYTSGHKATVPCFIGKNLYDLTCVGNSFLSTSSNAIELQGESKYCRLMGNTYEDISGDGSIYFNGTNWDDSQYNIVIETNYYNASGNVKQNNATGNIIIGMSSTGGRRTFAVDTKTIMNEAYTNNFLKNDGRYAYYNGLGLVNNNNNKQVKILCGESTNGINFIDEVNSNTIQFKNKSISTNKAGYRIKLISPDGNTTKYIGINNNGEIIAYDNEA